MNESITATTNHFSPAAHLPAIGVKLSQLDLFGPIRQQVQIGQKTVKHTPVDKLYDAFISLLAGAHGLVEINTRLRADPALQKAFGRSACAEQSVVQEPLDGCTPENVGQLEQAMDVIYGLYSQGYAHDYQASFQLLDVDMSGLPCGPKAAFARHRLLCRAIPPPGTTIGPEAFHALSGSGRRSLVCGECAADQGFATFG
jgi:hypothetical protein